MKYVIKNIVYMIKYDFSMFSLIILTVFGSGFFIHFAYAMYQNIQMQRQSDYSGVNSIILPAEYELTQYDLNAVTGTCKLRKKTENQSVAKLSDLKSMIREMSPELQNNISAMSVDIVLDDYEIPCTFSVKDGSIVFCESASNAEKSSGGVKKGRLFDSDEFEKGEKVAVAFDLHNCNVGYSPFTEEMLSEDETYLTLNEEVYRIVGWHQAVPDTPLIPITAVPDDTMLANGIQIHFAHAITSREHSELIRLSMETLDNLFSVPSVDVLNLDYIYLNNTVIGICILIVLCAGLNIALIYRYIILKRQKTIMVFQICGMTTFRAIFSYITECILVIFPVYILSVFCFWKALPLMKRQYYYINAVYPWSVYTRMFEIYFLVSVFVIAIMLIYSFSLEERLKIGGGSH